MSITVVHCSIVWLAAVSPFLLGAKAQSQCSTGDIRLVGGNGPHEGRVEVFVNGKWGTVCDNSWNTNDAIVVCRQLGYTSSGATALSNAHFGQGSEDIVMNDVACSGSESKLTHCSYTSSHNCGHNEDASVQCQQSIIGVCSYTTACTAYRNVIRTISTLTYTACGFLWLSRCSRMAYRTTFVSQSYTLYKSETECCTGYTGDGQSCSPVCSGGCNNGLCSSPGNCTCNSGWTGTRCTTAVCSGGCNNGWCSSPGICTCNSGWTGTRCTTAVCSGECINGQCSSSGICTCHNGWTGTRCTTAVCSGGCKNGRCSGPEYCTCNSGWKGTTCTTENKNDSGTGDIVPIVLPLSMLTFIFIITLGVVFCVLYKCYAHKYAERRDADGHSSITLATAKWTAHSNTNMRQAHRPPLPLPPLQKEYSDYTYIIPETVPQQASGLYSSVDEETVPQEASGLYSSVDEETVPQEASGLYSSVDEDLSEAEIYEEVKADC